MKTYISIEKKRCCDVPSQNSLNTLETFLSSIARVSELEEEIENQVDEKV